MTTKELPDLGLRSAFDADFDAATAEELRTRAETAPGWLWHGYLGQGLVTLLTSQWKCGKTTLLSILVARMALGGTLAGRSVRPGRVLVVSEEERKLWAGRGEQLQIGPHARFMCRPFRGRRPTLPEWRGLVEHLVVRHRAEGLDLVVIDALAAFVPGGSENDAGTIMQMLLALQELTALGIAVLILHHPRKGTVLAGQAARGSGALGANADIIIEMDGLSGPTEDDRRRRLAAFSRYQDTPRRLVIEWTADGTDYTALGDFNSPELDDTWQVLFWVLEDAKSKLTRDDILQQWPPDYRKPDKCTVGRWLNRAVKDGRVLQSGTGHKHDSFVYWLDGMDDVWKSDPYYMEPLPSIEDQLGLARRKTLAEVLAERKAVADGSGARNSLSHPACTVELRVDGKSWEEVSATLHYSVQTCRSWPVRYPGIWHEMYLAVQERQRQMDLFMIAAIKAWEDHKARYAARRAASEKKAPPATPPVIQLQYRRSSEYECPRAAENASQPQGGRRGGLRRWIGKLFG